MSLGKSFMSKPHNPENTYTGFRPRVDQEAAFFNLKRWGENPQINKTFSAIINSILDGLNECAKHTTRKHPDGRITIELNLGEIEIK
jgi:hypothetical protein